MQKIKDFFARWWLAIVIGASVLFAYLFYARGRTIEQLQKDLSTEIIKRKLDKLTEVANNDQKVFEGKLDYFNELKRKHAELTGSGGDKP